MSLRTKKMQAADDSMSTQPDQRLSSSQNMTLSKTQWREHLKTILQRENPQSSVQTQNQLCKNLLQFLEKQNGIWAGYWALRMEPDLNSVYKRTPQIEWAYPRMEADHLTFYISQNFIKGPFGVMEPAEDSRKVGVEALSGVLVPGLGFNKKGRRLGKGRGFYDKALEAYQGPKIGICFDCQVVEEDLPEEEHDIRVDVLVTEKMIIQCK